MSNVFSLHKVTVISGGGGGPPDVCIPVTIQTNSLPSGIIGTSYAEYIYVNGTPPVTWSLTSGALPTGLSLAPDTGLISGIPTIVDTFNFQITATNTCPSSNSRNYTMTCYIAPYTIRWGNYEWPEGYGTVPTFTESDFITPSVKFHNLQSSSSPTRVGPYYFPLDGGCHNIIWIAASLLGGSPHFKTGGDPWGMYPGQDLALQALTIAGIPGYVFYSAYQNADYTVDVT